VKTLAALPSEDELLYDTIQLVDQAPNDGISSEERCSRSAAGDLAMFPVQKTKDGASWSPVVATGRNRSPIALPSERRIRAKPLPWVATTRRKAAQGKEEVDPFRAERLALLTHGSETGEAVPE
jgi:hypothetical protein